VGNAWAQDVTGTAAAGAEPPSAGGQIVLFLIILTIFYFFLIRPQQKRLKEHSQMVSALRRGDRVVTGGGIIGSITKVEDTEVHVEIAPNVRIRVVKGTIT